MYWDLVVRICINELAITIGSGTVRFQDISWDNDDLIQVMYIYGWKVISMA